MKWDVTCWYIVEAKDQAEARAKVLAGDYLDMDVEDIEEYQEPLADDSPLRRDSLGIIWGGNMSNVSHQEYFACALCSQECGGHPDCPECGIEAEIRAKEAANEKDTNVSEGDEDRGRHSDLQRGLS